MLNHPHKGLHGIMAAAAIMATLCMATPASAFAHHNFHRHAARQNHEFNAAAGLIAGLAIGALAANTFAGPAYGYTQAYSYGTGYTPRSCTMQFFRTPGGPTPGYYAQSCNY